MRFIDFFAGIGGFRLGMEMAGHECVGHCEIDNFADKSYRAMHIPKESEWFAKDIRTVEYGDLPKAECYCFGFPCQSFSIAGSRGGFTDTRGTLFFEVMRIAKERKPEYLFAENVAGLLSHDGGRTFGTILATLGELGYWWEYQVLNSKNFGVPQNRERVFIIGHLGGRGGREIFPIGETNGSIGNEIKRLAHSKYFRRVLQTFDTRDRHGVMVKEATKQGKDNLVDQRYIDGISDKYSFAKKKAQEMFEEKGFLPERFNPYNSQELGEVSPTITACCDRSTNSSAVLIKQNNFRIRKLTPKECWRLQGFPGEYFERAKAAGVSDSQLYKQAGNSVTVNVIYEIAKRLKEV